MLPTLFSLVSSYSNEQVNRGESALIYVQELRKMLRLIMPAKR